METTSEFMADQKPDGDVLDAVRRKKEPDNGGSLFVSSGRAAERKRAQTIRDVLQVRICAQPMGSRCLPLLAHRSAAGQERDDLRTVCQLDPVQQCYLRSLVSAPLPIGLVC